MSERIPERHPEMVPLGRDYGCQVEACVPFDPEYKGGAKATVIHRLPDGVSGRGMQAAVDLGLDRLELVPHFLLGPAGDLAPGSLPIGPEVKRDGTDVSALVASK